MKNLYKIIPVVLLFFLSAGCKSIIKKAYGVKDPKFETIQTASNYLEKYSVENENLWITRDFNAYTSLLNTKEPSMSFPDAYFFNAQGKFLDYRKSAEDCNANVENFINELSEIIHNDQGGSFSIDYFLEQVYDKNLQAAKLDSKVDGYVVITWSIFMGDKLNKEKAFDWVSVVKKLNEEGLTVHYFLLNLDPQKSWGLTQEQEEELLSQFKFK